MGIRTDLLVTEEIAKSSDLRATRFEFERAKRYESALSILEGKWKIVILNRLFARPVLRFSELERAVPGISQRMLSQQLRFLEKVSIPQYCPIVHIFSLYRRSRSRQRRGDYPQFAAFQIASSVLNARNRKSDKPQLKCKGRNSVYYL